MSLTQLAPTHACWLLALSDPEGPGPDLSTLPPAAVPELLAAARAHLILPVLWRRLREMRTAETAVALDKAHGELELLTAHGLLLTHYAGRIAAALAAAQARFAIVKGRAFAPLYPHASDRPFTDIDMLVQPEDRAMVEAALEALDFVPVPRKTIDHSAAYGEFKWTARQAPNVLVEVHLNLVHYPLLRRTVSLSLDDLAAFGGAEAPAGRLMVAVAHAAAGHKFHALRLIVDVLQAARAMDVQTAQTFAETAVQRGWALEAGIALDLAARLYGDARTAAIAALLPSMPARALAARLLSETAILDAPQHGIASRLRRTLVRGLQHVRPTRRR
ncbi:nucleotidyltransferase family protein [Ancylobacter polymorphus]|uniref:Nucleotidyltransferase family protein n=1 Tax=Ancylobacter polymorphus TaxID=223390 RepID=A0ABU0BIB8_9HYPH|nr:nucleotidyltransferase family protein [Ancylobacter polymorphus]MDQ0304224.1 hypothetical protein [Ancylobacter polymorphus]